MKRTPEPTYHGTLTLGGVIKLLEGCDEAAAPVYFDFGNCRPSILRSYRGDYSHLALGFDVGDGARRPHNVADVLKTLRDADGATFEGYKGGDYKMTRDTPLWVANNGDWTSTAVVGVDEEAHAVFLLTARVP